MKRVLVGVALLVAVGVMISSMHWARLLSDVQPKSEPPPQTMQRRPAREDAIKTLPADRSFSPDEAMRTHSIPPPEGAADKSVPPKTETNGSIQETYAITPIDAVLPSAQATVEVAAPPVIVTDHRKWTVIGQEPTLVDSNRLSFSEGIVVAHSNGMWMSAAEGTVALSKDGIASIAASGRVELRAANGTNQQKLSAQNAVIREAANGEIVLSSRSITFETETNGQPSSPGYK